jgi:archaellum component FlaC
VVFKVLHYVQVKKVVSPTSALLIAFHKKYRENIEKNIQKISRNIEKYRKVSRKMLSSKHSGCSFQEL